MAKEFFADEDNYHLTLSEMVELGLGAKFKCSKCYAEYNLDMATLLRNHGGDTRLRYIQRNTKCEYCDGA